MRFLFICILLGTLLSSCGYTIYSIDSIYDGEITKVVHMYPDPAKLGDLEDEYLEEEGLISDYVFSGIFEQEDLVNIKTYYSESKEYTDENASEILSYFEVVSNDEEREENKCVTMYRDLFLFYIGDDLVACCKVCFSCDKEFFVDIKGGFDEELSSSDQHIMVDIKGLEEYIDSH